MTSHTRLRRRTVALVLALTYASLLTQLPLTSYAVEVHKIEAARLDRKTAPLDKHKVMNALGKTPISFEANHGQAQRDVKFVARGSSYSLRLGTKEAVLQLERRTPSQDHSSVDRQATEKSEKQARVSMKFIGANSNPRVLGQNEIAGKSNYFIGKDPKQWRTGVTNYSKVRYQELYQGIDLVFYGQDQDLEYDFVVAAGADPNQIRLEFKGADKVSIDSQGDLVLQTRAGELLHRKPLIYQEVNGERQTVEGRYTLRGKRVGFELANYDRTKELVIDPVIVYSTLLGGTSGPDLASWASGIAIYEAPDGKVYAYVVGITTQLDFPVKNAYQANSGGLGVWPSAGDIFVAKFDMASSGDASLIYSTYLGGSGDDLGAGIAIDVTGNTYVTGSTASTDFPILKAVQSSFGGSPFSNGGYTIGDAFVTAINSDGASVIYSTYLGGFGVDYATAIAVDGNGNANVKGRTESQNFPIINGLQTTNQSPCTYFVAKIAPPSGATPATLVYSTYLNSGDPINPGSVDTGGNGIAVDSGGNVFVTGVTASTSFPILNGFQTTLRCPWGNAFLIKLNPAASGLASLVYSTYLGGSCNNFIGSFVDAGRAVALDASGNAYVTGVNLLEDFPVSGSAFMSIRRNGWTTFVAKIDPSKAGAASLIYSTLLGGSGGEASTGIAVDSQGNAYVTGDTGSADFPLVNAAQSFNSGVFQSNDGGSSWAKLNNGMMVSHVSALVIDSSTTPRTLYASARDVANDFSTVAGGVFRTTNGGVSWTAINNGLTNTDVRSLLISPSNPSTIYAGTGGGIFVSTDGGSNWSSLNGGLSSEGITTVNTLAADSNTNNGVTTVTLYLGTEGGLFKLVEGSNTWSAAGHNLPVASIAIDSKTTPHTIYATRIDVGAYVSTDGGSNWNRLIYPAAEPTFLAVDTTTTPSTLYAVDQYIGFLWRRSPNDFSWQGVDTQGYGAGDPVSFIIDERTTPSTLYIADLSRGIATSSDGGNSWTEILRTGVSSMAIDKASSSIPTPLYAGVGPRYGADCFVAKLNSTGSALLFSTVVGDIGSDFGNGITLDSLNNIYIAGKTQGGPFPTVNAFQSASRGGDPSAVDAFALKIGSVSLPSTSATNVTTEVVVQTGTLALDFPNITGSTTGNPPVTTVDPLSSTATANLTLSNNLGAYDIKTTAIVNTSGYGSDPTQGIKLTFTVPVVNDESVFNALVITHGEDQNADGIIQPNEMIPYNGTIDPNKVTGHDFATRTVWVYVPSLSPFVIVKGVGDQIADLIRLVDSFNLKAGIENSLDKKLENALKAYQAAQAKQRATACNVMGAFTNETLAQTNKSITQSQADQLITAANQIKLVLGCR